MAPTTSTAEVTHISKHGFWLLVGDEELHLPFEQFPWFRQATIEQITTVEHPTTNHLYWPSLDVDLAIDSIRRPADFPLIARGEQQRIVELFGKLEWDADTPPRNRP
ncbi:MAG: hypothetical protein RLZZ373_3131 [Pseudomonadota bacterium]|jgi:hypothetical protein